MNILTHLQELDDLIAESTKPPITPVLRNKLAFCIEQAQAHSAAVERQEHTLATQIKTIERLEKEKQEADSQLAAMQQEQKKVTGHFIPGRPRRPSSNDSSIDG